MYVCVCVCVFPPASASFCVALRVLWPSRMLLLLFYLLAVLSLTVSWSLPLPRCVALFWFHVCCSRPPLLCAMAFFAFPSPFWLPSPFSLLAHMRADTGRRM